MRLTSRPKHKSRQQHSEVLHLNLHREFFAAIAARAKRIEYRQRSAYWQKRLEGRPYQFIIFRNGYSPTAPDKATSAPQRG
jgi:hypothetical protein